MSVAALDRMSCMRRDAYRDVGGRPSLERAVEDRMSEAAMHRMSGMRRDAYRDVGGRPRLERAVDAYRDAGGRPRRERRSREVLEGLIQSFLNSV